MRHQPQHRILEVVALEWVTAAQAALIRVDGLGSSFVLGAVEGYELSATVTAVDFQVRLVSGERENGRSDCVSVCLRLGIGLAHGQENTPVPASR